MKKINDSETNKSIFRALFVPFFLIMTMQACLFYVVAVYGGIEQTLSNNAADILDERIVNRKNEIETLYNKSWIRLEECRKQIANVYGKYCYKYGSKPLTCGKDQQQDFLCDISGAMITALRKNEVNGIFVIVNNQKKKSKFDKNGEQKIGLCIRDLDQKSNYTGVEDLLIERAPTSVISDIKCSLDSGWEARYTFNSEKNGDFYYNPLNAAWDNPDAEGENIAYFAQTHKVSRVDKPVVSYSMPLMDEEGYPYAVLGVELTIDYLSTLMSEQEIAGTNSGCYILAMTNKSKDVCKPIAENGAIFNRCFTNNEDIKLDYKKNLDGFNVIGRDGTKFYGNMAEISIYNNNNPFEDQKLVLVALVNNKEFFSYISKIKHTLAMVALISLILGILCIIAVSRRFAQPITRMANKVRHTKPKDGFKLGRIGIYEIDQLVESIEELNRTASRDTARMEFFSRMSHDMRTPMNAIISFSSPELLDGADEAVIAEYLDKIHSSGEYLLGLINEVLDMTKIESDKIDIVCKPQKTSKLWETIITIIDKVAQKKGVIFKKDISEGDYNVMVDEQHLNQIVMNLLSNAVKFTDMDGVVSLKVSMTPVIDEYVHFVVLVEDSGIGMSEEFMDDLYTPFVQEHDSREGTGLGLSIAKKLIEMMGGTIKCVSRKGVGTKFILDFRLQMCKEDIGIYENERIEQEADAEYTHEGNVDAEVVSQEDNNGNKAKAGQKKHGNIDENLKGKHVLVCEDHPLNTQIIVRLLERAEMEIETAENGEIGFEMFKKSEENTYDAVLMDIRMPVMDGLETSRAIRSLDREDAKTVPIIAMTANAFEEDVRASKKAGMNAHLSKPIDPQKVYDTLSELIV